MAMTPSPRPFQWRCIRHAGFGFSYRLHTVDGDGMEDGPINLAGYHARMMVRDDPGEDSPLRGTMDSQAVPPTITFTESGLYPGVTDTVSGGLPDTLTGLLPEDRLYADLRMIPPGDADAWYLFAGPFIVEGSVTTP